MNTMNTLNMNTLTIVALAYWALAALWAGFRGMIRTVLAFLVIVLTVFVTYTATPVVYQSLHGSANVNNYLQKQSGTVIENLANGIASGTDSTGWMEILPLPEEAQQVIALGDHALIAQMLTQEPTKSTLAIQLANIITRILSTILTAVSVFIILTIIRFILLRIADLPGFACRKGNAPCRPVSLFPAPPGYSRRRSCRWAFHPAYSRFGLFHARPWFTSFPPSGQPSGQRGRCLH